MSLKITISALLLFFGIGLSAKATDEIVLTFNNTNLCAGTLYDITFTSNLPTGTVYKLQLFKAGIQIKVRENVASPFPFSIPFDAANGNDYSLKISAGAVEAPMLTNISVTNMANVTLKDGFGNNLNQFVSLCAGSNLQIDATLYNNIGYGLDTPVSGTITYQWQKDGINLANTTKAINITDAGSYLLTATQNGCSFSAQVFTLTTNNVTNQLIFDPGKEVHICEGSAATLSPRSSASSVTYQWQKDFVDIPGATSRDFIANNSGNYRLKFTDVNCTTQPSIFSEVIKVNVGSSLPATINAANTVLCGTDQEKNNVNLSFDDLYNYFQGPSYSYSVKFQKDGVDLPGSENKRFYKPTEAGNYRIAISQGNCTSYSNSIEITEASAFPKPIISRNISAATICEGSYQLFWNFSGNLYKDNLPLAYNTTYFDATQAGIYKVIRGEGTSCANESDPYNISFNTLAPTIVAQNNNTVICGSAGYVYLYQNKTNFQGNFSYQWQRNGIDILGETNRDLNLNPSKPTGTFRLKVTNGSCTEYSNEITVTSANTASFTLSKATNESTSLGCSNRYLELNSYDFFIFGASIAWYKNGEQIQGQIQRTISINTAGAYQMLINTPGCTATSNTVIVSSDYVEKPGITHTYTATGASATLTAHACTGTVNWWAAATGGTALGTGTTFVTPALNSPTNYFASCASSNCESARAKRTVVLDQAPDQITISLSNTTYCAGASISIPYTTTFTTGTLHKIQLFKNGTEIAVNEANTNPISINIPNTAVYGSDYSIKISTLGTESNNAAVTVLNPTVSQSTALLNTNATFTATGCGTATVKWQDLSNNAIYQGNPLNLYINGPKTLLASCQNNFCETAKVSYEVVISEPSLVINSYPTNICAGASINVGLSSNLPANSYFTIIAEKPGQQPISLGGSQIINGQININQLPYTIKHGSGYTLKISYSNIISASTASDISIGNLNNSAFIENDGLSLLTSKKYCTDTEAVLGASLVIFGDKLTREDLTGITYQWQKDGVNVGNNQNPINITAAGTYRLIASYAGCTSTSSPISVQFDGTSYSNNIQISPQNSVFCEGTSITLAPTYETTTATYQWKLDDVNIPGATSRHFIPTKSGKYYVQITDKACTYNSFIRALEFTNALPTELFGSEKNLCGNNKISLSANNFDNNPFLTPNYNLSLIWQKDGVDLPGNDSKTINIATPGQYRYKLTQGNCTSYSRTHEVVSANTLDKPILSQSVGQNFEFCFGNYPLYWNTQGNIYKDNIIVATNNNYYAATAGGSYKLVRAAGTSCEVASDPVVLTQGSLNPTIVASRTELCGTFNYILLSYNNIAQFSNTYTFQWQKNGSNINGATQSSYSLSQTGTYRVLVSNGNCSEFSNEIVITQNNNLVFNLVPTNSGSLADAQNLTCSNRITSLQPNILIYNLKWYKDGIEIPNALLDKLNVAQAGTYTASTVSNGCTATSNPFVINSDYVNPPSITHTYTATGASATLTAHACTGTVNWWAAATGGTALGTGTTFVTPALNSPTNYFASCASSNCESARAKRTVVLDQAPDQITISLSNTNFCAGGSISVPYTTTFTSGTLYKIELFKNGVKIGENEAGTNPLVINIPSTAEYGTDYSIKISAFGTESNLVTLTILNPTVTQTTIITGGNGSLSANGCGTSGVYWKNVATNSTNYTSGGTPLNIFNVSNPITYEVKCATSTCETAPITYTVVLTSPILEITNYPTNMCAGTSQTIGVNTNLPANSYFTLFIKKPNENKIALSSGQIINGQLCFTPNQYNVANCLGCALIIENGATSATTNYDVNLGNLFNTSIVDKNNFFAFGNRNYCENTEATVGVSLIKLSNTLNYERLEGFSLQWLKNGEPFAGNQNPITITESGNYQIVASLASCTVSQTVNFLFGNTIGSDISPFHIGFCEGTEIKLLPSYESTTATYQWKLDNVPILGATDRQYFANKTGIYSVDITDKTCSATSSTKLLTINDALKTRIYGQEKTLCGGQSIYISASSFDGNGQLYDDYNATLIWQKNGIDIPGQTFIGLNITEPGTYRYKLTQGNCTSYSPDYEVVAGTKWDKPIINADYSLLQNNNFCSGSMTLYWSTFGIVYKDNVPVNSNYASTYNVTQSGTYKLVRDPNNSCSSSSDDFAVTVGSLNPVIKATSLELCGTQDQVNLIYSNLASFTSSFSFRWYKDGIELPETAQFTQSSFQVYNAPGIYKVKVTNGNCTEFSNEITISQNNNKVFSILPAYNETIANTQNLACTNRLSTLRLDPAILSANQIKWYKDGMEIPNQNGYELLTPTAGSYTATVTGSGCNGTSNPFVVNSNYVSQPTITQSATMVGNSATLTATGCNGTTNWYDAPVGGTLLGSGFTYTTPSLNSTLPYYADCTTTSCKSTRQQHDIVLDGCTNMTSIKSGSWYEPTTWSCGRVPLATDHITINAGHQISITYGDPEIKTLQHAGRLDLKNDATLILLQE